MEAPIIYDSSTQVLAPSRSGVTCTVAPARELFETAENDKKLAVRWNIVFAATRRFQAYSNTTVEPTFPWQPVHVHWGSRNIAPERTDSEEIFDTIQAFYLSNNSGPRDRQIAGRITALHRAALSEGERIRSKSLGQFKDFFLSHRELSLPKITLTPDGTVRARWIHGPGNFVALEFTGEPLAKLVAEIPRANGLTARHFSSEPISNIVAFAQACGASFA